MPEGNGLGQDAWEARIRQKKGLALDQQHGDSKMAIVKRGGQSPWAIEQWIGDGNEEPDAILAPIPSRIFKGERP